MNTLTVIYRCSKVSKAELLNINPRTVWLSFNCDIFLFQERLSCCKQAKRSWVIPSSEFCMQILSTQQPNLIGRTSDGVMVSKLDWQTFTSEFESHKMPHSYDLVPYISKKLCILLQWNLIWATWKWKPLSFICLWKFVGWVWFGFMAYQPLKVI